MTNDVLSVAGLADRWDVSTTHVYNLLNSGELEGFKLGRKLWRIKLEAVERFENAALDLPPTTPAPDAPPEPAISHERNAAFRLARLNNKP